MGVEAERMDALARKIDWQLKVKCMYGLIQSRWTFNAWSDKVVDAFIRWSLTG